MGYYVTMVDCDFFIAEKDKGAALKAIQGLDPFNGSGGGRFEPETGKVESWFSWICTNEYKSAETLEAALKAWRWPVASEPTPSPGGDIDRLEFEGDELGDAEHLFRAIAPFVRDGSWIEIEGEEERWRWCFVGGEVHTTTPTITWPDPS